MEANQNSGGALAPPPRDVPGTLRVAALVGGATAQRAWLLLALMLGPIGYFVLYGSVSPWVPIAMLGPTTTVAGTVTDLDIAGRTPIGDLGIGAAFGMEAPQYEQIHIRAIRYRYRGPDGTTYEGRAPVHRGQETYCERGRRVQVEYANLAPSMSRVSGVGDGGSSWDFFLSLLFWGAVVVSAGALLPIGQQIVSGLRSRRLLARGVLADGQLIEAKAGTLLGVLKVTRRTYNVYADGGMQRIHTMRFGDVSGEIPVRSDVSMLADPERPGAAMVLAEFPSDIAVDENGQLSEGDSNPYLCLLLPTAVVMACTWLVLAALGVASVPSF
jgi:hypothetical protein